MGSASTLEGYIAKVSKIVGEGMAPADTVEAIRPLHAELVGKRDWLEDKFLEPVAGRPYSQYCLHIDPDERFSLVAFVWPAGSTTPIHDHCAWGVVGIYQGVERGTPYTIVKGSREEGQVELEAGMSGDMHPGDVATVLAPNDVHTVENPGDTVAISIHCYGTNIGPQERFAFDLETGAVKQFVSGYDEPA